MAATQPAAGTLALLCLQRCMCGTGCGPGTKIFNPRLTPGCMCFCGALLAACGGLLTDLDGHTQAAAPGLFPRAAGTALSGTNSSGQPCSTVYWWSEFTDAILSRLAPLRSPLLLPTFHDSPPRPRRLPAGAAPDRRLCAGRRPTAGGAAAREAGGQPRLCLPGAHRPAAPLLQVRRRACTACTPCTAPCCVAAHSGRPALGPSCQRHSRLLRLPARMCLLVAPLVNARFSTPRPSFAGKSRPIC